MLRASGPRYSIYGSRLIQGHVKPGEEFIDLTKLTARFLLCELPASRHFMKIEWIDESGKLWCEIRSTAFVVESAAFQDLESLDQYLQRPGLHYVMCVKMLHNRAVHLPYILRSKYFPAGTDECRFSMVQPKTMVEILREHADPDRYPHKCPRCSSPAYVGFNSVDCSRCE